MGEQAKNKEGAKHNLPNVGDFAYACLIVCWISTCLMTFVGYVIKPSVLAYGQFPEVKIADFVCFYEAGKIFWEHSPINIYSWDYQLSLLNQIITPLHSAKMFAIPYPPTGFVLFAPLALSSLNNSYQFFSLISLLIAGVASFLIAKTFHPDKKIFVLMFVFGALVVLPSQITFRLGQTSWILMGLLVAYILCFRKKQNYLAGIALGLLFLKPQYAIFLFVAAIARRRWNIIYGVATVALVLSTIAIYKFGIHSFYDYIPYLSDINNLEKYSGINPVLHANFRALFSLLMPAQISLCASIIVFFLGLLFDWYIWRRYSNEESIDKESLLLAITTIVALSFSPHTHYHDLLLLVPAAAIIMPQIAPSKLLKINNSALRCSALIFCMFPLLAFIDCLASPFASNIAPLSHMLATIILACSSICYVLRTDF